MGDVRMRAICVRQIKPTYVIFSAHVKIASRRVYRIVMLTDTMLSYLRRRSRSWAACHTVPTDRNTDSLRSP